MIKAAICGAAGRMGKTILEVIGDTDGIAAGAAIEQSGSPALGLDAGEQAGIGRLGVSVTDNIESVLDDFDVLIDFTRADAVLENLEACRAGNKKAVIGTTGLTAEQQQVLQAASEEIAIVFAPNMSVGVNLCFKLAELAASIVGNNTDIEIIEAHHNRKVDAPLRHRGAPGRNRGRGTGTRPGGVRGLRPGRFYRPAGTQDHRF